MEIEDYKESKKQTNILTTMPEVYLNEKKIKTPVPLSEVRKNYKSFLTKEFLDDVKVYKYGKKEFQKIAKNVALLGQ